MLTWIFNISVISALIILILHYLFDYFLPKGSPSSINLQVQKYKTIIDKLSAHKATTSINDEVLNDADLEEELNQYVSTMAEPSV
jgi:hypothetical protein